MMVNGLRTIRRKINIKYILFQIIFFAIAFLGVEVTGIAQVVIQSKIIDGQSKLPLEGVTVQGGANGTITDAEGNFTLSVTEEIQITVTYTGYRTRLFSFSEIQNIPLIELEEESAILDAVTVTGSKYERKLSESTVSVEVLKPDFVNALNTNKGDDVLNKITGVQVIGGQANVRGGSGFSYGAGSRVMVLLDDIPVLQTDAGLANWGDMPIECLGQIEVLKGAASTLYGSSALNGVINFRRQTPTSSPITTAFISFNKFFDPEEPRYKWWGDTLKYRMNVGFSHARKIGKLDLNIHGFYSKYDSYAKNTFENKERGGIDLKYHFSDRIKAGINFMYNHNNSSDYFIWRNALRGIYEPLQGTVSAGSRIRMQIDPFILVTDKFENRHKLQSRIFYTNNQNNANQANKSTTIYNEYQYQRNFGKSDLLVTAGAVYATTNSDAELFGDTSFLYTNIATYLQLEKKIGDNLSLSGGIRYEYNNQASPDTFMGFTIKDGKVTDGQLISRLGLNYEYAPYSSIRASWGQGYRYPTVTERFISTLFGGFTIFPNPLLKPEYGWSSEIGVKQGFDLDVFKGFLDLAAFISEYEDMIEFTFQESPAGFRPINVGNTRITGAEASVAGKVTIWKIPVTLLTGYTYINPIYKNFEGNEALQASLSTDQNVLKYRSKYSYKADIQAEYKMFSIGFAIQHYSHMINIDKTFERPFGADLFEIEYFRKINNKGYSIADARLGVEFSDFKLSFYLNNVFNKAYTIRPALLEAPRNASIRLDYKI